MTIETTDTRDSFAGNDVLESFTYEFWCDTASAIKLVHITSAGVETVPVYDTDYTVTLDGDNIGGTITFPKAGSSYETLATGETLVCYRQMPITQAVNLRNVGATFRSTLMGMVDRVVAALQDKDTDVNRTLRQPDSDTTDLVPLPAAADRANTTPVFDANGQLTVGSISTVAVSSTMTPVVQAATLAAGRTALGVEIGTDVQAYDADTTKNDVANTFTKTQTWTKGGDVASAGALALGDGNYFDITGTTSITSIGTKGVGTIVKLHFDDALTLTHHATDLILPSGANITTAAGDEAEFVEYASGDWRCTNYSKASGEAVSGGGKIGQVLQAQKTDTQTISTSTLTDVSGLSQAITPAATSSKVLVILTLQGDGDSNIGPSAVIDRGGTDIGVGDAAGSRSRRSFPLPWMANGEHGSSGSIAWLDSPNTTSATTYKVQAAISGGSMYINRTQDDVNSAAYNRFASTITLMEVLA